MWTFTRGKLYWKYTIMVEKFLFKSKVIHIRKNNFVLLSKMEYGTRGNIS